MEQIKNTSEKTMAPHKKEWILAAVLALLAYFYLSVIRYPTELARVIWWKAQLNTEYLRVGFAWLIFTMVFLVTGLWYVSSGRSESRGQKWTEGLKKLPKDSWIFFALTTAAGMWCPIYMKGDQDVGLFVVLFLHGAAVYWLMTVSGSIRGRELDERGVGDLFRGFFVLPFSGYSQFFCEGGYFLRFVCQRKSAKHSKAWQIGLGMLISLPILCIAVPILRDADVYFDLAAGAVLQGLLEWIDRWDLISVMFTTLWTLVLAGYFFGLFYRSMHKKSQTLGENAALLAETDMSVSGRWQAPPVVLTGFLLPILILYLLFFGVRLMGITGAMDQIAAGELWISTYAREGFFELCGIAAINFVIFTVARWYSPQANRGMRFLIGGLGVETIAFVALAFSKMWYYIRAYGSFTFKRAMCCWLLVTLLVTFGLMTWELWNKKVKGIKWGVLFGSVTFLLMAYSNMPLWAP